MKLRTPTRPKGFSGGAVVKNLLANAEDTGLVSELGRSPGEGNGSPCPPLHLPPAQVCLPGKSHEQRSLVSYSPWGPKRVGHHLVTKQQHIQIHGTVKHRFVCLWNFVILFGTWPDNQWHLLAGGSPVSDHCRPSKSCLPAQDPGPFVSPHLPPGLSPSLDGLCPAVGVERTSSTWEVAFAPGAWGTTRAAPWPGMSSRAERSSVLWTESGDDSRQVTDSLRPMGAIWGGSGSSGPLEYGLAWLSSQLHSGWPALVFTLFPSLSNFPSITASFGAIISNKTVANKLCFLGNQG